MNASQLLLVFDGAELDDADLVDEVCDNTAILTLGSDDGIGAQTAADLRARRLAAARELVRRWGDGPA